MANQCHILAINENISTSFSMDNLQRNVYTKIALKYFVRQNLCSFYFNLQAK